MKSELATPSEHEYGSVEYLDQFLKELKGNFHTLFLHSKPGMGKTYWAYDTSPAGYYAVTLTVETPSAELRGSYMPDGRGGFKFNKGPGSLAMEKGCRLVLNEISHAGQDVLSYLHPILEGYGTCRLTLPTGETIVPKDGFQVVATDNCPLEDLPEALQDRFQYRYEITKFARAALASLKHPKVRVWAAQTDLAVPDGRYISMRTWGALDVALMAGAELQSACAMIMGAQAGATFHACLVASDFVQPESEREA